MDKKKIVTISLIIASVFVYLVASQVIEMVYDQLLDRPVFTDYYLTIPQIGGAVIAVIGFFVVFKMKKAMNYFEEVVVELMKVVYPTPKESGQSAVVVVLIVGAATGFLASIDWIWSGVTQLLLSVQTLM